MTQFLRNIENPSHIIISYMPLASHALTQTQIIKYLVTSADVMPPHVRAQGTFVQSVSLDKKWACYWRALSSWGRRRRTRHNNLLETTASYYYKTLWSLQKLRTSSLPLHRSWTTYRRGRFYWTCFSRMLWNVSCKKYTLYARRKEIAFGIGVGGNLLCCYELRFTPNGDTG